MNIRLVTIFSLVLVLSACGGGGGGGGNGGGSLFDRSGVEADVTAENAELISASVIAAVDESGQGA